MAGNTATLAIQIISDATKAAKGFQQAQTQTSKFESGLKKANKVALVTSGVLLGMGAAGLKQASQLQQSTGAIQATFGKQSKAVAALAKNAADTAGLSASSYQQLAATFGAQLKNMGVATDQLVPKTDSLIKLGADLAATYGGTTSDAVSAISSLLRGEADPIERYAVGIKKTDINARLAAQGQDKLTGAAKKQAETQAVLALLTEQTASAQGQFAREGDTAEGSMQRMQAKLDNMAASMATVLLPAAAAAATALAGLATFVEQHNTAAQIAIGVIAGLAAAVFAVNAALRVYKTIQVVITAATKAWALAQKLLNRALRLNPIGLVVTAVALLIAGLILAYKKSATFRAIVQATGKAGQTAIGWVVTKATDLWKWISKLGPVLTVAKNVAVAAFKAYTTPIRLIVDWVGKLIAKIRAIKWPKPPAWVTKVLNGGLGSLIASYHDFGGAGGASVAYMPAVFTAPGSLKASGPESILGRVGGAGGPSIVQINVNGALDPNAVAKQIETLLRRRGIRLGNSL